MDVFEVTRRADRIRDALRALGLPVEEHPAWSGSVYLSVGPEAGRVVVRVANHPPSRRRLQQARRQRRARGRHSGKRRGVGATPIFLPDIHVGPGYLAPCEAVVMLAETFGLHPPRWAVAAGKALRTRRAGGAAQPPVMSSPADRPLQVIP